MSTPSYSEVVDGNRRFHRNVTNGPRARPRSKGAVVNRIPPSTHKRRGSFSSHDSGGRPKNRYQYDRRKEANKRNKMYHASYAAAVTQNPEQTPLKGQPMKDTEATKEESLPMDMDVDEQKTEKETSLHDTSVDNGSSVESADNDMFGKLDPNNEVHARRISQRRKCISKGKNTVGYHEYVKQVPVHRRHPRSMKTPSTPDATLDIPAKRWQGLVRAWRVALHAYDPPDLMTAFNEAADASMDVSASSASAPQGACTTTGASEGAVVVGETPARARELQEAAATGLLLVDLGDEGKEIVSGDTAEDKGAPSSPISILSHDSRHEELDDPLAASILDDCDSDDDLL